MGWQKRGGQLLQVLLLVVLVSLLVGAYLGQPILLSFVETGSMEPTLDSGDGFVAVPAAASGEIERGDVVVFNAQQLNGGGLTTHRVVGETDAGYVTRGDANPFTDQDSDEPPVTDGQIVATALQVNGEVLVIPGLGTASTAVGGVVESFQRQLASVSGTRLFLGTQGIALLIAGAGAAVLLYGMLFEDDRQRSGHERDRDRNREGVYDPRRLVLAMALFITLVSGGTMVAMSNTQEYGMISAEFDSEDPTTVPVGESSNVTYPALNAGQLPVYAFYSSASSNVEADRGPIRMDRGAQHNVTLTLQAPPETGFYPQYVQEYRYFAVLPEPVIVGLYGLHPWLPILAVSATMGGGILLLGFAIAGTKPVRIRESGRDSWL